MQNLFKKLNEKRPPEQEQETKTLEDLLCKGKEAEQIQWQAQQYCPPPTQHRLIQEPHLSYRRPTYRQTPVRAIQAPNTKAPPGDNSPFRPIPPMSQDDDLSARNPAKSTNVICWNCKQPGHRRSRCPNPLKLVCFKCGQVGHTVRELVGRAMAPVSKDSVATPSSTCSVEKQALVNYIISHADGDQRPYLEINILGHPMLGLLDSGSRLHDTRKVKCSVANGQVCSGIGVVKTPVCLMGKVSVLDILVVPALSNKLILGTDFLVINGYHTQFKKRRLAFWRWLFDRSLWYYG
ncbi:hypothetical protein NQ317_004246 [Molorchus minor]|uniref:CCHC-type domain-containing protein n=1 Tax=Molorchus minor TaxID=1323400 RepID=A0ABQ9JZS2_9CUCU|nr:hypothetical protein NQ317_004246 [Molorchus minor]